MKTRIKVKNGLYYPQHRMFGVWVNLKMDYGCEIISVSYNNISDAKNYIDKFLYYNNKKCKASYIKYPECDHSYNSKIQLFDNNDSQPPQDE